MHTVSKFFCSFSLELDSFLPSVNEDFGKKKLAHSFFIKWKLNEKHTHISTLRDSAFMYSLTWCGLRNSARWIMLEQIDAALEIMSIHRLYTTCVTVTVL